MTIQEAIFLTITIGVGVPSALFNLTSVGLVASCLISQLYWYITGDGLGVPVLLIADYAVIVLIFAKPDAMECPYTGLWTQLCALWGERTKWDKIILSIFPFIWFCYFVDFVDRWWVLWLLFLSQIFVAAVEGYSAWRKQHSTKDQASLDVVSHRLAWSGHV